MIIRKEMPQDHEAVYSVVKEAFAGADQSDGTEQDLVAALRNSDSFIPELSLVAECDGMIIGHILFTKVHVGNKTALALAPLSVLPSHQNQGVGTKLIMEGHKRASDLGYAYSIVLGHETYYPRFGYLPAQTQNITAPFDVPSKNFMVCRLREDASPISGVVQYAPEFGIN